MGAKKKSRKKRVLMICVLVLLAIAAWVLYDLYAPRTAHLREFDADEVARLETAMWIHPPTLSTRWRNCRRKSIGFPSSACGNTAVCVLKR